MFERLSHNQKLGLIKSFLRNLSYVTKREIKELISVFPFEVFEDIENINFWAVKLFLKKADLVNINTLSEKLNTSPDVLKDLFEKEQVEVNFPVSDGINAVMIKALVIPLEKEIVVSPDPVDTSVFEPLIKLTKKGMFITFSRGFDFKSKSFLLAIYSAVSFGKQIENIAFTGIVSEEGNIEEVEHLDRKIEIAKEQKIPLLYPHKCLKNVKDLKEFLEDLKIPIAVIPQKDTYPFENMFPFSSDYIRSVFHIDKNLFWTEKFEENIKSFNHFSMWAEEMINKVKEIREKYIPAKVSITSSILCMSFYLGVLTSKAKLPVEFYTYSPEEATYKKIFDLKSDIFGDDTAKDLINIQEPEKDIKEIYISSKSGKQEKREILFISTLSGKELDKNVLKVAQSIAREIRKRNFECAKLILETSNALSFALGYYIEDYKCLHLTHRTGDEYAIVYTIQKESKGNLYLLNAFSINMLSEDHALVEFKKIPRRQAIDILKNKEFLSYISHPSTARILKKLIGKEIEYRRTPLKLKSKDKAIVFQLGVRPQEGKIFSEGELEKIIEEGKYDFFLVKVY